MSHAGADPAARTDAVTAIRDRVGGGFTSGRSAGGYRLYTDSDVERLRFVTRLKRLRFSLDEIRELITLLDVAAPGTLR